jgi:hypothetical protein
MSTRLAVALIALIAAGGLSSCSLVYSVDKYEARPYDDAAPDSDTAVIDADAAAPDGDTSASDGDATTSKYVSVVEAEGPIAWWRLGETTGPATDRRGKHDGTYMGGVVRGVPGAIAGDPDGAASFAAVAGDKRWVQIGDAPEFDFTGMKPYSVEAWVKPSSADGTYRGIVDKETLVGSPATAYGWVLQSYSASVGFFRENVTQEWASTTALPIGVWTHLVVTFDGSTLTLYVDGKSEKATPATLSLTDTTGPLVIGIRTDGSVPYNASFLGSIDEVAIYDKALSATAVAAHNAAGRGL